MCWPEIEFYPSLLSFEDIRIQFPIFHQEGIATCQAVGNNIARAQFLEEEFTVGSFGEFPLRRLRREICHNRQTGQPACIESAVNQRPGSALLIKGPAIMARFESDNDIQVFFAVSAASCTLNWEGSCSALSAWAPGAAILRNERILFCS